MLFEQTQSIVSRIQQILREYPYGDAVLLELLQNADDAGASACHINLLVPRNPVVGLEESNDAASRQLVTQVLRSDPAAGYSELANVCPLDHSPDLVRAVLSQQHVSAPVVEFFNDSVFTERDLCNIQSIGGSLNDSKKHDGTKVGRFGLGFNSAYHISDVILFVSARALVVFDPSRTFLPPDQPGGQRGGGYRWDFIAESARLEAALNAAHGRRDVLTDKDLFFLCVVNLLEAGVDVYHRPRFSRNQAYAGTLFRLPLRQQKSALWSECHSLDTIAALVVQFPQTAMYGLVLTKHVTRISASITTIRNCAGAGGGGGGGGEEGAATSHCRLLYDLFSTGDDCVHDTTDAIYLDWLSRYTCVMQHVALLAQEGRLSDEASREQRSALPNPECHAVETSITLRQTDLCVYALQHHTLPFVDRFCLGGSDEAQQQLSTACEPLTATETKKFTSVHQFGPGGGWESSHVWAIAEECARYSHPISVPWGTTIVENHRSLLVAHEEGSVQSGKIMCFFPIQSSTGLPVHIHGHFQLSSDRQSVASVAKNRWNSALCSEVIPFSYAAAVELHCVPSPPGRQSPLQLWPLGVYTSDATVESIASKTIQLLQTRRVFPCRGPPVLQNDATPQKGDRLLPWESTYVELKNIRCFGGAHPATASQSPFTVNLSMMTADAYEFLLKVLPPPHDRGGSILYVPLCSEFEYLLPLVADAFSHRGVVPLFVTAAYLREELLLCPKPAFAVPSAALPVVPNKVAIVLLCGCLHDNDYELFIQEGFSSPSSRTALPLIPLVTGVAGMPSGLMLASSSRVYQLASELPFRERLVLDVAASDACKTDVPQLALDAAKRHLEQLCARHVLFVLNQCGLVDQLACFLNTSCYFERRNTECPNNSNDNCSLAVAKVEEEGVSHTSTVTQWQLHLLGDPSDNDPSFVVSAEVVEPLLSMIAEAYVPQHYALCILPRMMEGSHRRFCVSAAMNVCVARSITRSSHTSEVDEVCVVFDTLVSLGAIPIDSQIVPLPWLSKWTTSHHRPQPSTMALPSVAVIDASPHGAHHALCVLHATLPKNQNWVSTAYLYANLNGGDTTRADYLRRFFARYPTVVDSSAKRAFIESLPIFRTIWSTYTAAVASEEDAPLSLRVVPPKGRLPHIVRKALCAGGQFTVVGINGSTHAATSRVPPAAVACLATLRIVDREEDNERQALAARAYGFVELTTVEALTLAACRVATVPIFTPLFSDEEGSELFWRTCFEEMSRLDASAGSGRSPHTTDFHRSIVGAALEYLARCPLFSLHSSSSQCLSLHAHPPRIAPCDMIDIESVPSELVELLEACWAEIDACGSDGLVGLPVLGRSSDILPKEYQAKVFALIHAATNISDSRLVALATASAHLFGNGLCADNVSRRQELAIALLRYLEGQYSSVTEVQWRELEPLLIVPAAPCNEDCEEDSRAVTGQSCLFRGFCDVCSPDVFRLCPTGKRRCLVLSLESPEHDDDDDQATKVFPNISKHFRWANPPPLSDVLSYVESKGAQAFHPPADVRLGDATYRIREWYDILDYIEQGIRKQAGERRGTRHCDPHQFGGKSSAASDSMLSPESLKKYFRLVYLPERGRSFRLEQLALHHPQGDAVCEPYLLSIDAATSERCRYLWTALGIPRRHLFSRLEDSLLDIVQQQQQQTKQHDPARTRRTAAELENTILSASLLGPFIRVLQYMVEHYPEEARRLCQVDYQMLLPTEEEGTGDDSMSGSPMVLSQRVFYTLGEGRNAGGHARDGTAAQGRILHSAVPLSIAKALGLHHGGLLLVSRLHAMYGARHSFRARGQHHRVTDAIKRILGDYSDRQSIIMEMLQNADDAGARNVTFYLDTRSHKTDNIEELLGPEMVRCQGPSLVVTNDRRFSEADFNALYEIGCGHKAKDHLSIGRFGLGFNSVYHVTDCPSVISGDTTLFLDPSAQHVGCATLEDPGLMIQHTMEPSLVSIFAAQFAPYQHFGVDFTSVFPGTLFRLPLRDKLLEGHSLSGQLHNAETIRRMFTAFGPLMPHVLLFLKHIEVVSFVVVAPDGKEELLSKVDIHDEEEELSDEKGVPAATPTRNDVECREKLRKYRSSVIQAVAECAAAHSGGVGGTLLSPHLSVLCPVRTQVYSATSTTTHHDDKDVPQHYSWILSTVVRPVGSGPSTLENRDDVQLKHKLLPWGSVAVQLADDGGTLSAPSPSTPHLPITCKRMVRAANSMVHCFLPLPSVKGELPFHVHGCFALTSDRRGMWTRGVSDDESWEVCWNRHVLRTVVSEAALRAIEAHPPLGQRRAIASPADCARLNAYYDLFPIPGLRAQTTEIFEHLRVGFFQSLFSLGCKLFWTMYPEAAFVEVQRVCCDPYTVDAPPQVSTFSVPQRSTAAPHPLCPKPDVAIIAHLLGEDECLCQVPESLLNELTSAARSLDCNDPTILSPQKIAKELRVRAASSQTHCVAAGALLPPSYLVMDGSVSSKNTSNAAPQPRPDPNDESCATNATVAHGMFQLTRYLVQERDASLTQDIPLVLLDDETIAVVGRPVVSNSSSTRGCGAPIYVSPSSSSAAARDFFPEVLVVEGQYFKLVNQELQQYPKAWSQLLNVEPFSLSTMSKFLHQFTKDEFASSLGKDRYDNLDDSFASPEHPLRQLCTKFWAFVHASTLGRPFMRSLVDRIADYGDLGDWPLIPACADGGHILVPISKCRQMFFLREGQAVTTPAEVNNSPNNKQSKVSAIRLVFERLGVVALDEAFEHADTIQQACGIPNIKRTDVADVLQAALQAQRFTALSHDHRDALLEWLLGCLRAQDGSSWLSLVPLMKTLPLFPVFQGNGWRYVKLDKQSANERYAIPAEMRSGSCIRLCEGLHRNAIPELGVHAKPLELLFKDRYIFGMLCPLDEMHLLYLLSRTLRDVASAEGRDALVSMYRNADLVPIQALSLVDVANIRRARRIRMAPPMLKQLAADWLADSYYFLLPSPKQQQRDVVAAVEPCPEFAGKSPAEIALKFALEGKAPHLFSMIQTARLDHLDFSRRMPVGRVVLPLSSQSNAATNNGAREAYGVVSELMGYAPENCFTRRPCAPFFWDSPGIRELLVALQGEEMSPLTIEKDLEEAARSVAHISVDSGTLSRLSWSLGRCVLAMHASFIQRLSSIPFIVPDPLTEGDCPPCCTDQVPSRAIRLSSIAELIPFTYRWATWLVKPIMPASLGYNLSGGGAHNNLLVCAVLEQLSLLLRSPSPLPAFLPDDYGSVNIALESAFKLLVELCREQLDAIAEAAISHRMCFALPQTSCRDGRYGVPLPPLVSAAHPAACVVHFSQIVVVEAPSYIGCLQPHFYHLTEFDAYPPQHELISLVLRWQRQQRSDGGDGGGGVGEWPRVTLPSVEVILKTLRAYHDDVDDCVPICPLPLHSDDIVTYCSLLKLLVDAAAYHKVMLVSKNASGEWMPSASISALRVPNQLGQLSLIEASQICNPDDPALLRRIDRSAVQLVHGRLSSFTAARLGVPSIAKVVVEVQPFIEVQPHVAAATAAAVDNEQKRWDVFTSSDVFLELVERLWLTSTPPAESLSPLDHSSPLLAGAPDHNGAPQVDAHGLPAVTKNLLRRLSVLLVSRIAAFLAHRSQPNINIASKANSPLWTVRMEPPTVLVCAPGAVGDVTGVPRHYCVALGIQQLLLQTSGSSMTPMMLTALSCVLEVFCQYSGQEAMATVLHRVLDKFDCEDGPSRASVNCLPAAPLQSPQHNIPLAQSSTAMTSGVAAVAPAAPMPVDQPSQRERMRKPSMKHRGYSKRY